VSTDQPFRGGSLPVLTVSQFTDVLKEIVEQAFPLV
jgi:hypothetical protein